MGLSGPGQNPDNLPVFHFPFTVWSQLCMKRRQSEAPGGRGFGLDLPAGPDCLRLLRD